MPIKLSATNKGGQNIVLMLMLDPLKPRQLRLLHYGYALCSLQFPKQIIIHPQKDKTLKVFGAVYGGSFCSLAVGGWLMVNVATQRSSLATICQIVVAQCSACFTWKQLPLSSVRLTSFKLKSK